MIEWWDREGEKNEKKKYFSNIFILSGYSVFLWGLSNNSNVYPPLLFLILLRPWYSHCLKGTFCVHLFDEKWFFCFVIIIIFLVFVWSCSFFGKLMLFILYLIRNCNLIWSWWSGCVCVSAQVRVCVRVWIKWLDRWAGDVWIKWQRTRGSFSLFASFPPSLSPSLLSERRALNLNVSYNKLIVSLTLETQSYLSAAS